MMRSLAVVAALSAIAHADTITVVDVGATIDARAHARTFDDTATARPHPVGGLRLTLSFERPPLVYVDHVVVQGRIVPELLVGMLADDKLAEGYLGAGLRLEGAFAARPRRMSGAVYLAGRGIAIGRHQDGAGELAVGEYCLMGGARRVGWEAGAIVRPHDRDGRFELDAMLSLYVGWGS
jgi:hypothetical protein